MVSGGVFLRLWAELMVTNFPAGDMGSVLSTQRLRFGYCSGTNHVSIYKKSFLCKNYSKTAGTIVHGILSLIYDEEKIRQYKNGRLVRNQ